MLQALRVVTNPCKNINGAGAFLEALTAAEIPQVLHVLKVLAKTCTPPLHAYMYVSQSVRLCIRMQMCICTRYIHSYAFLHSLVHIRIRIRMSNVG